MTAGSAVEQLDVLIIGAGISGLGMACTLRRKRPSDRFAVLESRADIGGTWDLFRYPGIRSDSDMYTFAYSFKPWRDRAHIGKADRIRHYLHELVREEELAPLIRFSQRATRCNWNSSTDCWEVDVETGAGDRYRIEARFLVTCTGYYNYAAGYLPEIPGLDDFSGQIMHPQLWPEKFDYADRRIVVIGSGATAMTMAPAMAATAEHVTLLQRSPSYVFSRPSADGLFRVLAPVLPKRLTNRIMRAKYISFQQLTYFLARRFPKFFRRMHRHAAAKALAGSDVDVDTHFNPRYPPWDQRVCVVTDNDLFDRLKDGSLSILTDRIERVTKNELRLGSGEKLRADLIVPATGLDIQVWGGIETLIDGVPVQPATLTNYKGMMFGNVPNVVTIFGYSNATWTLKAELSYGYVCRLLDLMEKRGHQRVFPLHQGPSGSEPIVGLRSGYIRRALGKLPTQGDAFPWRNKDSYLKDLIAIRFRRVDDGVLTFDAELPADKPGNVDAQVVAAE